MKLYAIRDRLLEYFQRPFIGDTDATVLAAVATAINTEANVDFAQTPTHFEVWQLAEISEESGQVRPTPKFISNCSDLRRGIREDRIHRAATGESTAPAGRNGIPGGQDPPGTHNRPPQGSVESQASTPGQSGPGPEGTDLIP